MILNFWFSCLYCPNAGIIGSYLDTCLRWCWASTLPTEPYPEPLIAEISSDYFKLILLKYTEQMNRNNIFLEGRALKTPFLTCTTTPPGHCPWPYKHKKGRSRFGGSVESLHVNTFTFLQVLWGAVGKLQTDNRSEKLCHHSASFGPAGKPSSCVFLPLNMGVQRK